MKNPIALTTLFVVSLLNAEALGANVVSLSISKQSDLVGTMARRGVKRATILENLDNGVTLYAANVTCGTPPKPFTLQIDTGSSDTYVMSVAASQCQAGRCRGGMYDAKASSTYKLVQQNGFRIRYVDGSGSSGDMISDNFGISGVTIKNLQIGLATRTSVGHGLLGIGYDTNEAGSKIYPNFIDELLAQNLINYKAFSLYLDDLQSSTGSILFGGIDTNKFSGALQVIPFVLDPTLEIYREFLVPLTSLTVPDGTGKSSSVLVSTINVVLDSGASFCLLPASTVRSIITLLKGVIDRDGNIFVDCNLGKSNSYWVFSLSTSITIRVSFSEMLFPVGKSSGAPFANTCQLGIQAASSGGPYLLGDTFLRSAYVVYDLSANQIGIAQASFDSTSNNIQEIPKSATGIPLLTGLGAVSSASGSVTVTAPSTSRASITASRITSGDSSTSTDTEIASGGGSTSTATRTTPGSFSNTTTTPIRQTSGSAAGHVNPPLDSRMMALAISCLFALLGGSLVWA